jgi:hypothetical protein
MMTSASSETRLKRAEEILDRQHGALVALAKALHERCELTDDEVRELVSSQDATSWSASSDAALAALR